MTTRYWPPGTSIGVTIAAAVAAYWLIHPLVPELAARAVSILVIAAGFWATEALPLFATAFVVIGPEIVLLATDGGFVDALAAAPVSDGNAQDHQERRERPGSRTRGTRRSASRCQSSWESPRHGAVRQGTTLASG